MAAFAIACQRTGMLQTSEKSVLDHGFRLRQLSTPSPPITLVVTTETDLQQLKQWPLSDETLAQVIQTIQNAQPSVIGLNLHRDQALQPGTQALNQIFATSENLIGVRKVVTEPADPPLNPPTALAQTGRIAASDVLPDRDGRLRRHLLALGDDDGNIVLSLGARVALDYLAREQGIKQEPAHHDAKAIRLGQAIFQALKPSDGGYVEADGGGYQILSNFYDSPAIFETISINDLLRGEFEEAQIRDRIVLIGTTAPSLQNPFFTPMTQTADQAWFGVELQADLAGQIVAAATAGRPLLRGAPEAIDWLWIMLWASGGAILGTYLPSRQLSLMLALPLGGILLLSSGYLLLVNGWWMVVIAPGLAFVGAGLLSRRLVLDQHLVQSRTQLLTYQSTLNEQVEERTHVLQTQNLQLVEAQQQAEASNQAKSDFLTRMSHELRTPLNSIIGFSSLMRNDTSLGLVYRENLGIIRQSGEYLLSLINDVLDFAKIEANQVTVEQGAVNLHTLIASLESMFRLQADQKRIKFRCSIDAQVPQYITTDERKLRQVLINLLGNAIKFTPGGHVILRIWKETDLPARLHFEVEDTGVGIAQAELDTIFEPFTQSNISAAQASEPGTGLGLAISKNLVQRMDGKIWANSQPGQGSRFHVTLPLQTVEAQPTTLNIPQTSVFRTVALPPPQRPFIRDAETALETREDASSPSTIRILIVDDSTLNRKLLKRVLQQDKAQQDTAQQDKLLTEQALTDQPLKDQSLTELLDQITIREANHGLAAIAAWETWKPDLILMDMRMPIMDGYEATQLIRKREKEIPGRTPTPIIAISASVTTQEESAARAAGCNELVQKPFRREQVLQAITQALKT